MSADAVNTATRFAKALDAEDYSAARQLLANSCIYNIGTTTLEGPDAILASYEENGAAAQRRFDAIRYSSQVESSGPTGARITYRDSVCLAGEWLDYHCRQFVRIGADGLIVEIRHEDLPGEKERLLVFENAHGKNDRLG